MIRTPERIIAATEAYYNFRAGTLKGHRRTRAVSLARAIAQHIVALEEVYSPDEISDYFNKDRTSVLYALKRIAKELEKRNKQVKEAIADIRSRTCV